MKDRSEWIERIVTEKLAEHDKRVRSRQAEKEAGAARHEATLLKRQHDAQEVARLRDLRDQPRGKAP